MARTVLVLALVGLLAALGAAAPRDDVVLVDDETVDVEPRVVFAAESIRGWPWWTTRRQSSTTRRWSRGLAVKAMSTTPGGYPYPTTTRRPVPTTTWRPVPTTTRRPAPTTTRRPTPTTTRRPTPTTTRRPTPTTTRRPTTTTQSPTDQSITIGAIYPFDRQLLSQAVYKGATIFTVNSEYLNWSHATATIHCIQIVDLVKKGKNAAMTVQQGGIGQSSVSIKFKSQRGGEINYQVIIWGQ